MDPPRTEWNTEAGTIGYFPTNTPYGSSFYSGSVGASTSSSGVFDFYCFDEPSCHWINFKREGVTDYTDHWHQNPDREGMHHHIDYVNETTMRVGKGYMMSVSEPSILMTDGVLNNGSFEADEFLRNTLHYDYGDDLRGINLVGNPYQSYLSFDALATDNECIGGTFYIYDEDELRYMSYTQGASDNDFLAPAYLHPHQGFLVRTSTDNVKLRFNNTMRFTKEQAGAPHFRNEKMNYPLVNLLCYSGEQLDDVTTVELNRPEQGGGYKLKSLYKGNSLLHVRMSGEDYQTAFTEAGTAAATVCFDALNEGNFTMRWQTMHGDFSYLHLIDHLTGLDFIDLQGRVLLSTDLADGQTHVSLPKVATGMYLLRMTNQNGMKVQKIIVR